MVRGVGTPPRRRVLMLRIFDLAPKGPDKSAQGIALGDTQRLVEDGFQPTASPERAEQSKDPRDVIMLVKNPSDERFGRDSTELFRPFRCND